MGSRQPTRRTQRAGWRAHIFLDSRDPPSRSEKGRAPGGLYSGPFHGVPLLFEKSVKFRFRGRIEPAKRPIVGTRPLVIHECKARGSQQAHCLRGRKTAASAFGARTDFHGRSPPFISHDISRFPSAESGTGRLRPRPWQTCRPGKINSDISSALPVRARIPVSLPWDFPNLQS